MLIDTDNLEKGCIYSIGVDGRLWRYFPRINLPLAKKINITTGEIIYPTNADRIRDMSDEELAETITEDWCSILCPGGSFFCDGECLNKMIEWLKQEVE